MNKKRSNLLLSILLPLLPLTAHHFYWMDSNSDRNSDIGSIQTIALKTVFLFFLAFLLPFGTSSANSATDRSAGKFPGIVATFANDISHDLSSLYVPGDVLVKFSAGTNTTMVEKIAVDHNCSIAESIQSIRLYRFKINGKNGVWPVAWGIQRMPQVIYAEPNYIVKPTGIVEPENNEQDTCSLYIQDAPASTSLDPYRGYQWHYDQINMPAAWNTITGGSGVIAAALDSGALYDHPDMQGRFTYNGFDFWDDDPDPTDITVPFAPLAGHGTYVAGIIGATTNNNEGVAGMTWSGGILPIRTDADEYHLSRALRYACGLLQEPGYPTNPTPVGVLNISMAASPSSTLEDAVAACNDAGVIMVCASGNTPRIQLPIVNPVSYPAAYSTNYDKVIAVGGTDYNYGGCPERAPYSNYGYGLNVVAPGGDIKEDSDGNGYCDGVLSTGWELVSEEYELGYKFDEGTSFAAPHVTGLVALMLAHGANPDNVRSILEDTAWDLGPEGWDPDFGYGLIDARAALDAIPKIAVIQSSASTVNSVDKALNDLGRVFEKFNTDDFASINLSPYNTVIIAMDGGVPNISDIFHLANFANTGGNLIMLGGSPLSNFAVAVDTFLLNIDTTYYFWEKVTTSPNLQVTNPMHPLAHGLPEDYDFINNNASYYMIRSEDTTAEEVAVNGDGETALLKKAMSNNGALTWFINSPNEIYWTGSSDYALLKQIIENGVGGSACIGDFDNDSNVDESDLAIFAAHFGRTDCLHTCPRCEGNFDTESDVDGSDVVVFVGDVGRTGCP